MIDLKKVFRRHKVEKVHSVEDVVTGTVSIVWSRVRTSLNIVLLLAISFIISHRVLRLVTCFIVEAGFRPLQALTSSGTTLS